MRPLQNKRMRIIVAFFTDKRTQVNSQNGSCIIYTYIYIYIHIHIRFEKHSWEICKKIEKVFWCRRPTFMFFSWLTASLTMASFPVPMTSPNIQSFTLRYFVFPELLASAESAIVSTLHPSAKTFLCRGSLDRLIRKGSNRGKGETSQIQTKRQSLPAGQLKNWRSEKGYRGKLLT